jgi:hypothetical protein
LEFCIVDGSEVGFDLTDVALTAIRILFRVIGFIVVIVGLVIYERGVRGIAGVLVAALVSGFFAGGYPVIRGVGRLIAFRGVPYTRETVGRPCVVIIVLVINDSYDSHGT